MFNGSSTNTVVSDLFYSNLLFSILAVTIYAQTRSIDLDIQIEQYFDTLATHQSKTQGCDYMSIDWREADFDIIVLLPSPGPEDKKCVLSEPSELLHQKGSTAHRAERINEASGLPQTSYSPLLSYWDCVGL